MSLAFTAPTKSLKTALARLSGATDRKSTMPLLANVLIRTSIGNSVVLGCTSFDVYATSSTTEWRVRDTGDMTVPLKQLADVVKGLSGSDTTIEGTDHGVRVTCGPVSTEIRGIPGRDFQIGRASCRERV